MSKEHEIVLVNVAAISLALMEFLYKGVVT